MARLTHNYARDQCRHSRVNCRSSVLVANVLGIAREVDEGDVSFPDLLVVEGEGFVALEAHFVERPVERHVSEFGGV